MKASRNHIWCLFVRERRQSSQTTNTLALRIKAVRAKYVLIYDSAVLPFIVSQSLSQTLDIFVYLWRHCCHYRSQWLPVGRKSSPHSRKKGSGLLPKCFFIKQPHFPLCAYYRSFIVFFSVLICGVLRCVFYLLKTSDLPKITVGLRNNAVTFYHLKYQQWWNWTNCSEPDSWRPPHTHTPVTVMEGNQHQSLTANFILSALASCTLEKMSWPQWTNPPPPIWSDGSYLLAIVSSSSVLTQAFSSNIIT